MNEFKKKNKLKFKKLINVYKRFNKFSINRKSNYSIQLTLN